MYPILYFVLVTVACTVVVAVLTLGGAGVGAVLAWSSTYYWAKGKISAAGKMGALSIKGVTTRDKKAALRKLHADVMMLRVAGFIPIETVAPGRLGDYLEQYDEWMTDLIETDPVRAAKAMSFLGPLYANAQHNLERMNSKGIQGLLMEGLKILRVVQTVQGTAPGAPPSPPKGVEK